MFLTRHDFDAGVVEVDGCVLVRRVDTGMPQPLTDRAQVDPGLQQVNSGAVTHAVWMQSLVTQRGRGRTCAFDVLGQDVSNAEATQGLCSMVEEDWDRCTKIELILVA